MEILHNISLKPYNTFGIDVRAEALAVARTPGDITILLQSASILPVPTDIQNFLILGEGSNILFTGNYHGFIVRVDIKGIEVIRQDAENVWVRAGAGENWDNFVAYCVGQGFGGLENLSGIPGSVGASPVQNIGAYGAEMKDCFVSLEAFDLEKGETVSLSAGDCRFGYRDSIFKKELKGKAIILSVTFRLSRKPEFNLSYQALKAKLSSVAPGDLTLDMVRDAVLAIRSSKLPDPSVLGNAGSFFKNPLVEEDVLMDLLGNYPDLVHFPAAEGGHKIAAGWLVEKCGWKGFRDGDAGVHKDQALVLVNYGNASGQQILDLAMKVRDSVETTFNILLEPEVQVIG